jgi:hypothetical protein
VPKKSKTEETKAAVAAEPVTSAVEAQPSTELKKPAAKKPAAKKVTAKKATGTKPSGGKSAAKKTAAKKTAKKAVAKKTVRPTGAPEPTDEEIRIRAYFIAERRSQLSLNGDPANDWIQARQELIVEMSNGSANGNGSHQS